MPFLQLDVDACPDGLRVSDRRLAPISITEGMMIENHSFESRRHMQFKLLQRVFFLKCSASMVAAKKMPTVDSVIKLVFAHSKESTPPASMCSF